MRGIIVAILALVATAGLAQIPQWTLTLNSSTQFPRIRTTVAGAFFIHRFDEVAANVVEKRNSDGTLGWQKVLTEAVSDMAVDGFGNLIIARGTGGSTQVTSYSLADGSIRYDVTVLGSGRSWLRYISSTDSVACLSTGRITLLNNSNGAFIRDVATPGDGRERTFSTSGSYIYFAYFHPTTKHPHLVRYPISTLVADWDVEVSTYRGDWGGLDEIPALVCNAEDGTTVYLAFQSSNGDVCAAKVTSGITVWQRRFGDSGQSDYFCDMALSNGTPVISCKLLRDGVHVLSAVKLRGDGTTEWSRYLSPTIARWEASSAIKTNNVGDIFLAGRVRLSDAGYREDAFACRLRPDGFGVWAYTYNGPSNDVDQLCDLAVSSTDACYAIGYSYGSSNPTLIVKLLTAQLTFSPTTVIGGNPSTGTVALNETAPAGGVSLALSDPSANLGTPANVTIPGGATSASFNTTTTPVSSTVGVTVTGQNATVVVRGRLSILAPAPATVSVSPNPILGGQSAIGTVALTGNTAAGGAACAVYENSPALSAYPSAYVPAGNNTGNFMVFTNPVSVDTPASISVSLNGTTRSVSVVVARPSLVAISTIGSSIVGGDTLNGTVYINGRAATGGLTVALSDSSSSMTVQPSATIAADEKTGAFSAITVPVVSNRTATITATFGSVTKTTTVTITPPRHSLVIAPDVLTGGSTGTGMVVLSHPAPTGGVTVVLSTGAPSLVGLPPSVFIPAGGSSRLFVFTTNSVGTDTTVAIFGTFNGSTQRKDIVLVP